MNHDRTDTVNESFSLDDLLCVKCGSELDTGFECNGCGFDMLPYVERLQIKQNHDY